MIFIKKEKHCKRLSFARKKCMCILMIALIAIVLVVLVRLTVAYLIETIKVENGVFFVPKVACAVVESGNMKNDVSVKNTGNVPAYVRLSVVMSKKNTSKEIESDSGEGLNLDLVKKEASTDSDGPSTDNGAQSDDGPSTDNGAQSDDGPSTNSDTQSSKGTGEYGEKGNWVEGMVGRYEYYYLLPLAPGETAETLINEITIVGGEGNFSINVLATAIQADPYNAVIESWGILVGGSVLGVCNDKSLIVQKKQDASCI